jgi:MFS family permease
VNTGYATSFFIPTIIEEMGFTASESQVRSIPIFIVAAVAALIVAWWTDRLHHRFAFTIAGVLVGFIGYVILLCQEHVHTGVKYMACFFITTGGYMTQPVTWTWLSNVSFATSLRIMANGDRIWEAITNARLLQLCKLA